MCRAVGTQVRHVKPHGWLYNASAKDGRLAAVIARAIQKVNPDLRLFGLAGSESIAAAQAIGLPHASEAFIDRTYEPDGSLSPRSSSGSVITNPESAAQQCLDIVLNATVKSRSGSRDANCGGDSLCAWRQPQRLADSEVRARTSGRAPD